MILDLVARASCFLCVCTAYVCGVWVCVCVSLPTQVDAITFQWELVHGVAPTSPPARIAPTRQSSSSSSTKRTAPTQSSTHRAGGAGAASRTAGAQEDDDELAFPSVPELDGDLADDSNDGDDVTGGGSADVGALFPAVPGGGSANERAERSGAGNFALGDTVGSDMFPLVPGASAMDGDDSRLTASSSTVGSDLFPSVPGGAASETDSLPSDTIGSDLFPSIPGTPTTAQRSSDAPSSSRQTSGSALYNNKTISADVFPSISTGGANKADDSSSDGELENDDVIGFACRQCKTRQFRTLEKLQKHTKRVHARDLTYEVLLPSLPSCCSYD